MLHDYAERGCLRTTVCSDTILPRIHIQIPKLQWELPGRVLRKEAAAFQPVGAK